MKYTILKHIFSFQPISIMFYGSFTTCISIFVFRYSALSKGKFFDKIEPTYVIFAAILFFLSGIIWFLAGIVSSLSMSAEIRENKSVEDYLEKIRKLAPDSADYEKIFYRNLNKWHTKNKVPAVPAFMCGALMFFAILIFLAALFVFLSGVGEFVHHSAHYVLSQALH